MFSATSNNVQINATHRLPSCPLLYLWCLGQLHHLFLDLPFLLRLPLTFLFLRTGRGMAWHPRVSSGILPHNPPRAYHMEHQLSLTPRL